MAIKARALATIAALGGLAVLTGCGTAHAATWRGAGGQAGGGPAPVAISAPADGATAVPTATELALAGAEGATPSVTLTDAAGTVVPGAVVPGAVAGGGQTWLPATQLKYGTTYTATVTAPGRPDGRKVTFTTMAKPAKLVSVTTPLADGQVYGVGLPIVVKFGTAVPKDQRADVERRLFVTSEPAQVGSWNWFNGNEVHYRPQEYWQSGTKLSVRIATGGLSFGPLGYGNKDVTLHATIGDKLEMVTDNATHTMTVTKNDQVVRSIPISLGKPGHASSSGAMVVISKAQVDEFVSTEPGDSYRKTVYWTQRITWSGQYLHAAPWSVGDQGKRNVSHGCTNMSTENAKWLFGITHVGDPVTVKGTERKLEWGNGWTDWGRSWDEYRKGSALAGTTGAQVDAVATAEDAGTG
jgi:lipoprotein-anchoring transpeptidase ErfK/SrfK